MASSATIASSRATDILLEQVMSSVMCQDCRGQVLTTDKQPLTNGICEFFFSFRIVADWRHVPNIVRHAHVSKERQSDKTRRFSPERQPPTAIMAGTHTSDKKKSHLWQRQRQGHVLYRNTWRNHHRGEYAKINGDFLSFHARSILHLFIKIQYEKGFSKI